VHAPAAHDEVHLTALGVPLSVSITGTRTGELSAALREAWAWCGRSDGRAPVATVTACLGQQVGEAQPLAVRGDDLDSVMEQVTSQVTMAAVDARAGELVMLHANGIADPESGRTVVMVGPSEAGKTTAALTLTPGRCYITDETLAVAMDGTVVPYPKPLSVRRDGKRIQVPPADLGALPPPARRSQVAQVWLMNRSAEHRGDPLVVPVAPVRAMATVARESSYLARLERPLHRLADLFEAGNGAFQVTYREAADLEALLVTVLKGA
jgi:hypothetical protein